MSSFINSFKSIYSEHESEANKWNSAKIRDKLINLIKDNATDHPKDSHSNDIFHKNIFILANFLLSESYNIEKERKKKMFLKQLLFGNKINVSQTTNYVMSLVGKGLNIIDIRKDIISLFKDKIQLDMARQDIAFDEELFYKTLSYFPFYKKSN